jgi:hypothetical protein
MQNLNIYNTEEFETLAINIQIILIIELFKEEDMDNYYMYKMNGLNDFEIFQIITSPEIINLYDF